MKTTKILLVGGGTGGHIYPLIQVVKEIKKEISEAELLILGDDKMADVLVEENVGADFKKIISGKWRRYFSFENLVDFFKIGFGFFQALYIIYKFKPDLIFSKGGFVALPLVLANKIIGKKLIIHESDLEFGATNKMAIKEAVKVCVGFPVENYKNLDAKKLVFTGVPISEIFYRQPDVHFQGVQKGRPKILVTGGSQGSAIINKTIIAAAEKLNENFELILITGAKNFDELKSKKNESFNILATLSNEKMAEVMQKSDLIISRAGASALAEIAAVSKPNILIPFALAAGNHQVKNAEIFAKTGASVVIDEKDLTPEKLISEIAKISGDKDLQKSMSENLSKLSKKDSAKLIVDEIKSVMRDE